MLKVKKVVSRIMGIAVVFSMILSCLPVMNVAASAGIEGKSFYEGFEGYEGTLAIGKSFAQYNGWQTALIVRQSGAMDVAEISVVDTETAKGNALNLAFTKETTDKIDIFGLYKNSGVVVGDEDIIISGDVYIPASNSTTDKQYVRFFVANGTATTPSFGLFFTKNNGADVWQVNQVVPTESNSNAEQALTDKDGNSVPVVGDKWFKIDYVYHPQTKTVDYYINGKYINTRPGTVSGNDIGGSLGSIVFGVGGKEKNASAMKVDEVSVKTVSSANEVGYSEVETGTKFINVRFDIPVDADTISDANITVAKLSEEDITFSGEGAENVSDYTVSYKDKGGVGIEFNTPFDTAYDRYKVTVTGMTDIFGNSLGYTHNCVVIKSDDEPEIIEKQSFNETFAEGLNGWLDTSKGNVDVSDDNGALKATVKTKGLNYIWRHTTNIEDTYCNITVDDSVEYMDIVWDAKMSGTGYKTFFSIIGADGKAVVGLNIDESRGAQLLGYKNDQSGPAFPTGIEADEWGSYKLRYYPWTGNVEIYTGVNQESLALLDTVEYSEYSLCKWDKTNSGSRILGFSLVTVTADSTTYFDKLSIKTYGYPVVEPEIVEKQSFNETFAEDLNGWRDTTAGNVDVSYDNGALKATVKTQALSYIWKYTTDIEDTYCNITVDDSVEYMDIVWDAKMSGSAYKTFFSILGADGLAVAGLNIYTDKWVQLLGYKNNQDGPKLQTDIGADVWGSYKLRYYPWTGNVEIYTGANQESLTLLDTVEYAEYGLCKWDSTKSGSRILGFSLATVTKDSTTYFDNLSIKTYGYQTIEEKAEIKAVTFEDVNGKMLGDNVAGAKKIMLHLDNTELFSSADVSDTNFVGTFDAENGIYTMELDGILVGDKEYILDVDGTDYFFRTGEGRFTVSNLRFTDGTNDITGTALPTGTVYAAVDAINSLKDENPVLIWAAYKGGVLEYVDFQELDIVVGSADTYQAIDGMAIPDGATKISTFLFTNFNECKPLINSTSFGE